MELDTQIEQLEAQIAELKVEVDAQEKCANVPEDLAKQLNIIEELWDLQERAMLRKYLSRIIDHIDLRTDGDRLVGTIYLRNLPELKGCANNWSLLSSLRKYFESVS